MTREHFETRAGLERQMDVARQLRAETCRRSCIFSALAKAVTVIRRQLLRITADGPRQSLVPAQL